MIRFVTGQLAEQDADGVVVGMGGMGFLVRVSDYTRGLLPPIGGEVTLKTHLAVREDALDLYGFGDDAERVLFMQLIGVSGIGPRMALTITGLTTPQLLANAIRGGEVAFLTQASGVGKKTAERVILELRDKVGGTGAIAPAPGSGHRGGARDGLLALGFTEAEVDHALSSADDGLDEESLIRHGLAALGRARA
jgi:Holliday junction DNA helicase RuvA